MFKNNKNIKEAKKAIKISHKITILDEKIKDRRAVGKRYSRLLEKKRDLQLDLIVLVC